MFTPLKGKDHTKEYLRNKEYRQAFKDYKQTKINQWIDTLSNVQTIHIQGDFNYILTPSFYDKVYQFTTFSNDMQPMSHHTYNTIEELVNDNAFFYLHDMEVINQVN